MPRWKLTLEYDGAAFCGWQRQDKDPSVQQALEEAILSFSAEEVRVHAAGRTDSGVHALGQVAHADIMKPTDADTVRNALNYYLKGKRASVLKVESVTDEFHARFSAKARHYMYRVINRRAAVALEAARAYHVPRPLNDEAMRRAANLLLGEHDFSTFRAQNCQSRSPIKTMDAIRIERNEEEVRFWFSARSYLYHQVRNMVGTLICVGTGQWSFETFQNAFAACDRAKGGPTAPSHALYFIRVDYE
jgi:tRNA pseudouridine38-40 synthase